MQLHLIIEIIDFIKKEIESKQIIARYEKLLAVIKKIGSNPDKDHSEELAEARNSVVTAQNETEPVNWSYSKYRIFLELDKDGILGKRAVQTLNSIFDLNQANPAGISKEIKKIVGNINRVLSTNTDALQILSCFSLSDSGNSEKALLTLFFEGKTSVNTIHDIERYSRIWDSIIRDFAILTMQDECESVVESIDKKSMIIQITKGDKILESLSYGTGKIIDTYSKILRIRKLQLEVAQLELNNSIQELLEEEITITINRTSGEVVTELLEMNEWKNQPGKDEVYGNVQKSLILIFDFIEKGGKIEFKPLLSSPKIAKTNRVLIESFSIANELENTKGSLARALAEKNESLEL